MSDAALPNPIPPLDASPEIKEMVERIMEYAGGHTTMGAAGVPQRELREWAALLRRLGEREARMREVIRDNALTENLATRATAAFPAYWQCNWCGGTGADANSIAHDGDCGVGVALAAGKEGE